MATKSSWLKYQYLSHCAMCAIRARHIKLQQLKVWKVLVDLYSTVLVMQLIQKVRVIFSNILLICLWDIVWDLTALNCNLNGAPLAYH